MNLLQIRILFDIFLILILDALLPKLLDLFPQQILS